MTAGAPAPDAALPPSIDLGTPLSLRTSFRFPLQHAASRREVVVGGALLLVPVVGWLLNMGHRIALVHDPQHGGARGPDCRHPAGREMEEVCTSR